MKLYGTVLVLLALIGVGLIVVVRRAKLNANGEAGQAYIENENGELIPAPETRGTERTIIPPRADGADEPWLKKFVLTERSGESVGSQDLKGTPYVAGFFFSTCPSICVQQNGKVKELQEEFKHQSIRFLSISCDPEVDTPEVLTEYAKRFDADPDQWLFMTGKMSYIRRVGSEFFSLGVESRGHPEKFALMDANGEMYGLYTWSDEGQWQTLKSDIAQMIAAGGVIAKKPVEPKKRLPPDDEL